MGRPFDFFPYRTLPYQSSYPQITAFYGFGMTLEPRYIFGAETLDQ